MNIVSIILISVIAFFAVIGIITGCVKGFTNVKSWAVELVLTGVISIAVSNLVAGKLEGAVAAIVPLGITLALICLFMLLFAIFRSSLKKRIEFRKQRSYYEHYDEMEDNTEQILSALGTEDKKKYKQLSKRKFKQSGGGWSVTDKLVGGVTLALKGAVMAGIIISVVLAVLDFTRLPAEGGALYETLGGIYSSGVWLFFKNYIFDFLVIGILMICIKSGFSNGISSALWTLIVIGLVVGAGALAFYLSFNVGEFVSAAERLNTNMAEKLEGIAGILGAINVTTLQVCQVIIGLGLFLFMLVGVILIAIFVPKLIDRARDGVIFRGVDGVLGAIVMTAIIFGIMFALGAVLKTLYELEFMNVFNAYFEKSGVATYLYNKNPLDLNLPIKDWLS